MIVPSFVSTASLSQETTSSIARVQRQLAAAQTELVTGKHADIGQELGAKTTIVVALRHDRMQIASLIDSNELTRLRLTSSQEGLKAISDLSQNALASLVRAQTTTASASAIVADAQASLTSLQDLLNSSANGQYLFAGINSDVRPFDAYFGEPAPASRAAVSAAYQAKFGFDQMSSSVSTITPAQMQEFIDNEFSALFLDPAWSATFSEASDKNVRSRIGRKELIETSANANEEAIRGLTAALVMTADLGFESLNDNTKQVLLAKAVKLAGNAVGGVADIQATLGVAQERLATSSEVLSVQARIIDRSIGDLEDVDQAEVATRLSTLMTQLESAYSITSRIHNLSILDYLT